MIERCWRPYFPFPHVRPVQVEGLDFIFESLNSQAGDIFVESPTGTGKSGVAITVARHAAAQGRYTYISTKNIELEDQYIGDFARLGLKQLHSRSHYECPDWQFCDAGARCDCDCDDCPYKEAKIAFECGSFGVANAAFLLTCARFRKDWHTRSIAIFDEAHLLHDVITEGFSFGIHQSEVEFFPPEGQETTWLKEHYASWLEKRMAESRAQLSLARIRREKDAIPQLVRKLERAEARQVNLRLILGDDPDNWIFDQEDHKLKIAPLWAASFAPRLLSRIGSKRIYLSATLPGFRHQCRYLGIDPKASRSLALPSPFPPAHRPIHVCPAVRWNWQNRAAGVVAAAKAITKILILHPLDRGLVHVSSYPQAQEIVTACGDPRLLTHRSAYEKCRRLEEMFARPAAVLVSPSSHEGLDLYEERSRFQVIAKLPFASLGDKRVQRRIEQDGQWYNLHTAQRFTQAVGRSVRSERDYATTYVIDAAFEGFCARAAQFFPDYLIEALRFGEVCL
jgi:Rad3-related DNA helicase